MKRLVAWRPVGQAVPPARTGQKACPTKQRNCNPKSRLFRSLPVAVGAALIAAGSAHAQCSMCRTVAAAQNAAGVLDSAILVLFLPALAMFSGTLVMAFRYRNKKGDGE